MSLHVFCDHMKEMFQALWQDSESLEFLMPALSFLAIFVGLMLLNYLIRKITRRERWSWMTPILNRFHWPFFLAIAFSFSQLSLLLPSSVQTSVHWIILTIFTWFGARIVMAIVDTGSIRISQKIAQKNKEQSSMIQVVGRLSKIVIAVFAFLFFVSNLGYDITALLAGLGISGIVIAFALQNILDDLFSSLSIYFDRPFNVDDFIIVGGDMGVVKKVGIQSTRIQTLQGQELIIPNKELSNARINNYKRMKERRVVFQFSLPYETPLKKVEALPDTVKKMIDADQGLRSDRVHLISLSEGQYRFEVVYFVLSDDYNLYMDRQHALNLTLLHYFQKHRIKLVPSAAHRIYTSRWKE